MKKTWLRGIALTSSLVMLLSACGTAPAENGKTGDGDTKPETTASAEKPEQEQKVEASYEIKDLVVSKLVSQEITTFNVFSSQGQTEFDNLCNVLDGLLEPDTYGKLNPCIATDWGTEDGGKTWTFHLRDDVKWVDMNAKEKAICDANDFATGMEWVLNFYKNDSNNVSMPMELIQGAREYYEYTKTLTKEEAYELGSGEGSKFRELVGVEIPDDHTVVYHCLANKPYFDTIATYVCLFPLSQGMVDELGVDGIKSMDNKTMWYNGAYTMTTYVQNNEKVFTKNPKYWDTESKRFDTVTIRMVESPDIAFQMYQSGEIDHADLSESNLKTISSNESNAYHDYLVEKQPTKYSHQIHLNFDKRNLDGTPDENWNKALANKAFRQSWYYGLDLGKYYTRINAINPMSCENEYYTMRGLVYNSEGTEYCELVRQELGLPKPDGKKLARLDEEKFKECKQQAIEELTAIGVTFPIEIAYYIQAGNQTKFDDIKVLQQTFEDSLGKDYVTMDIRTYVSSGSQEVYNPKFHSMMVSGWGADYGDPQTYLAQELYGVENALYSDSYSKINDVVETEYTKELLDTYKTFTQMVQNADAICDDPDARYDAYAKAEAYMISNVLVIPHSYDVRWCLTKINPYSQKYSMFGCQNNKMKNWETKKAGYTTEEVAALKEAHFSDM